MKLCADCDEPLSGDEIDVCDECALAYTRAARQTHPLRRVNPTPRKEPPLMIPRLETVYVSVVIGSDGNPSEYREHVTRASYTLTDLLRDLDAANERFPDFAPHHLVITRQDAKPQATVRMPEQRKGE